MAGCVQDENTRYVCIGPVNKPLNMLCRWLEGDMDGFRKCAPAFRVSFQSLDVGDQVEALWSVSYLLLHLQFNKHFCGMA